MPISCIVFYVPPFQDVSGSVFGRLRILRRGPDCIHPSGRKSVMWTCQCSCGKNKDIRADDLRSGKTTSCGCKNIERLTTHGFSTDRPRGYDIWRCMKQRCCNPNRKGEKYYFGRGVSVCERWANSFENFIEDMGFPPTDKHTIERENNDLGYSPGNCVWATMAEQGRNRRNSRKITIDGVTKCLSEWALVSPVDYSVIHRRLAKGIPPKEAVFSSRFRAPKS